MANDRTKIRVIVLAAGLGKRMRSTKPKVLHEVLGQPMLARVLSTLNTLDLEHIHVVVGHGATEIQKFVEGLKLKAPVLFHCQEKQLGTGHAIMQVEESLNQFQGNVLVLPADVPLVRSTTLADFLSKHDKDKAELSLISFVADDPKHYGRILRSANDEVTGIVEERDANAKQKTIKEVNSGFYCFAWPKVAKGLKELSNKNDQGEYYLTDLVAWAQHSKLKIAACVAEDEHEFSGINSKLDLESVSRLLAERTMLKLILDDGVTILDRRSAWVAPEVVIGRDTVIYPGCWLVGDVNIGESCVIGPHSWLSGRVRVGNHCSIIQSRLVDCEVGNECTVGPFAQLRPQAVLGDHVKVGNFVEIKNSSVGSHTNVSHLSYVGDTTVGEESNIGAGTITANYDHVTKKKSRTVIGRGSSTGCNTVLVAPVILGHQSTVAAGTVVTRDVPDKALAVGRARQENKEDWHTKRRKK